MSRTGGRVIRKEDSLEIILPAVGAPEYQQGEFISFLEAGGGARGRIFGLVNFRPDPDVRRKVVLNVENGRYVTSQIAPAQAYVAGQVIWFNTAADAANGYPNGRFQNVGPASATVIAVGIVTEAGPDAAGMIEFVGGGLFYVASRLARDAAS